MGESLQRRTVSGVKWSALERFATQGVVFIVNIILARILLPSDFGLIAMITVFTQISQAFIDSGLTNALIQRKDRTNNDYCTVFYFNISLAIIFYAILFIFAPLISNFYNSPQLTSITRVSCLSLILGALGAVHQTKLTINVDFKRISIVTFIAALISGVVGIVFAHKGYGVWSLVWMSLVRVGLQSILMWIVSRWNPELIFSLQSFRSLFSYSSKLLLSSLIHLLYYNLYTVVIGKIYNKQDLGYFNRAELFARFPSTNLSTIFSRVSFPIFSTIQDDNARLRTAYSKYIKFSSACIFPVMMWLIAIAKPLVLYVLSAKWQPIVPLLQILCIAWMTDHLCSINLNVLFVKGRSDLALKLEFIKKTIATIILLLSMKFGLIIICWGLVAYSLIAVVLNSYYTKPLIGLSLCRQFQDYASSLFISTLSAAVAYLIFNCVENLLLQLLIGSITMWICYLLIIWIFDRSILSQIYTLVSKSA